MRGYFFCVDILGFSRIVKNLDQHSLDSKINSWVSLIEKLTAKYKLETYQLLSDTLLVGVGDTIEDLSNLIQFACDLLNESILQSLPVRGAISFGEYFWGKLVYGATVIEAHTFEKKQNWIGVCLNVSISIDMSKVKNLVLYPIPMSKNEIIKSHYAISWNVPTFEELATLTNRDGLGGRMLDWDWGDKISNTVIFGLYLQALQDCKKTGETFHGYHPVHFIDLTLRKKIVE